MRGGQSELASEEGDVRAGGGQVLLVTADHVHPQEQRVLVSTQEVADVFVSDLETEYLGNVRPGGR